MEAHIAARGDNPINSGESPSATMGYAAATARLSFRSSCCLLGSPPTPAAS